MSNEIQETEKIPSWRQLREFKPECLGQSYKLAEILEKTAFKAGHKSADDIFVAINMGQMVGLNPFQAVSNIAVIQGKPTIWGDAIPAICQRHPDYEGFELTFDEETMTATCKALRKDCPPVVETFSKEDAVTAGLWGQNTWKKYPKKMLKNRARSWALKAQFADILFGLIDVDEARDMEPIDMGTIPSEEPKQSLDLPSELPKPKETEAEVIPPEEDKPKYPRGYKTRVKEFEEIKKEAVEVLGAEGFDVVYKTYCQKLDDRAVEFWTNQEVIAFARLIEAGPWPEEKENAQA